MNAVLENDVDPFIIREDVFLLVIGSDHHIGQSPEALFMAESIQRSVFEKFEDSLNSSFVNNRLSLAICPISNIRK